MTVRSNLRHLLALVAALLALFPLLLLPARAHEVRPAYLQIDEVVPGRYQVLWRTPVLAGMRLPVALRLPASVRDVIDPATEQLSDSLVERRVVDAGPEGLSGSRIEFVGLQATITDVLVRVQLFDGSHSTTLVKPSRPWVDLATSQSTLGVAATYLAEGIEHIWSGFDHLLFVLALVLIVHDRRVLIWTITAFTLAHSITLSLATLGVVRVPGPPVEATIALSIILLACEIVRQGRGEPSLTARWPWVVAFVFGLLHGFGFAGALIDIGLPQGDIPLALFSFNVGVEVGQIIFIGVILAILAAAKRIGFSAKIEQHALSGVTYGIGVMAAFWLVERLAAILT